MVPKPRARCAAWRVCASGAYGKRRCRMLLDRGKEDGASRPEDAEHPHGKGSGCRRTGKICAQDRGLWPRAAIDQPHNGR
eukprot:1497723-Amphidinium_carterae.1